MDNEVVITLYENHYHYGVAALINSLYHSGYHSTVFVGYRSCLPDWIAQMEKINDATYCLANMRIIFLKVDSGMHFGYYKPFVLNLLLEQYPTIEKVYYFDPDIVVNAPWVFFSNWVDESVGLCLDNCFPFVHHNHPWRKEWINLSQSALKNTCTYYINSGFVGVHRRFKILLDRWMDITIKYQQSGGDITQFEKDGHRAFKGDQDLLNAVITVSPDIEFSIVGQEGMGFIQPAYLMSHAVNIIKPWRKNYLSFLIKKGQRPDQTDKDYLRYANSPIEVFSARKYRLKELNFKVASILGRLVG